MPEKKEPIASSIPPFTEGREKASPSDKAELKREWKKVFHHRWLVKNISFFLFLACLALLYIYNAHYAETTIKNINRTTRALNEMQYEFKTAKTELMFKSKQSEIIKAVEPLGLKPITSPPFIIGDSTNHK